MKNLKMNWAKTSWLRNGDYGSGSLVSFDCFVPKDIFEIIKPSFEGYIQKNEKKTAVYNLGVIGALLENNHQVEIDGVNIIKEEYSNRKIAFIGFFENSTNETIARLAKLYKVEMNQKAFQKEVSKTVDEAFGNKYFMELSKGVKVPNDIKFETFRIGGDEYQIDFNYGVQLAVDWQETSHEDFHGTNIYRAISSREKLPELKQFLNESQTFANVPRANENESWLPGFDSATFESKKKFNPKR
jgi:hypothetical protein